MTKTNKKTLEEIIRVDHAGERGAIKIYEGQLLALKTFKQDEFLKKKIEEMKEHEKEHYEYFDNEIKKRNIKPTKLLPLWDLMGVTLGFGTAMLGEKAAMLCTASVEEVIDGHYKDQTYKLEDDEKELKEKIMKFRDDELHIEVDRRMANIAHAKVLGQIRGYKNIIAFLKGGGAEKYESGSLKEIEKYLKKFDFKSISESKLHESMTVAQKFKALM